MSTGKSRDLRDDELGMGCPIARRDFLNGVAVAIGAYAFAGLPTLAAAAAATQRFAQDEPGYYPPTRSGMRGSHPGSFEVAHSLRDGAFAGGSAIETGESYDLIVVGAGIGGLAAAHFYRKRHPAARILILDNHDDFGGHAKRNEFEVDGRTLLANGGTYAIESPFPYSPVARDLLAELGVDPAALAEACDRPAFYRGLGTGVFFDRETFGADRLVVGMPADAGDDDATAEDAAAAKPKSWADFLSDAPLTDAAKRDIVRVEEAHTDYMPGLTSDAKKREVIADELPRFSFERREGRSGRHPILSIADA